MSKKRKLDYGIDAPGIRMGMFLISIVGLMLLCFTIWARSTWFKDLPFLSLVCSIVGLILTLYGLFMASYMTYSSRIRKLKTRDFLLNEAGNYIKWNEISQTLDIGCGKGLLLIGAAKRLKTGESFGIDIWNSNDQSENNESSTLQNADIEGVVEKINLLTADARKLPFDNDAMDLVMSHWVIHNIETENEQLKSLDEMYRVLKPGGAILLADIQNVKNYATHLETLGSKTVYYNDGGFEAKVMSILSGGTYVPQSIICSKPK
jgi:ubiquinone/menaquinone biosynthesis C-methylase UbiE